MNLRNYILVTADWVFTLTDGALPVLVICAFQ